MEQEQGPKIKTHDMYVKRWILPYHKDGSKKYELRLASAEYNIKAGERIKFLDGSGDFVIRKVISVVNHPNLENFLEEVDAEDVLPGMKDEDILEFWNNTFSPSQRKSGIVVFELE